MLTIRSSCCNILKKSGETKYSPSYFSNRISDAKNQLISPEKYLEFFSFYKAAVVADVYYQYQKELKKNKALDFDDLIMKVVELFREVLEVLEKYQNRYLHLLVDEFQDTNLHNTRLQNYLLQKIKILR
jgi:DNA helicase-2/ATP-dependent DNA helicase PcrA